MIGTLLEIGACLLVMVVHLAPPHAEAIIPLLAGNCRGDVLPLCPVGGADVASHKRLEGHAWKLDFGDLRSGPSRAPLCSDCLDGSLIQTRSVFNALILSSMKIAP